MTESLTIAREHISYLRASGRDIVSIIASARLALWSAGLKKPRRIRFEAEIEVAFAQAWQATVIPRQVLR